MLLRSEDISIGITVYRRLDYLEQALGSAMNQTVPVRVRLYDDGCDDRDRLQRILQPYGDRVQYQRNTGPHGLFHNMNRCIWESPTPWVSVLHDDDLLATDFVERILTVAHEVGDCALFCGGSIYIDTEGRPYHRMGPPPDTRWRRLTAVDFAHRTWFPFPGHLLRVQTAQAAGGFPIKSLYTGDWELWFQLALAGGAVQLGADLGYHRVHHGADRGTTAAAKTGRKTALCAMQAKRNFSRLQRRGMNIVFDRRAWTKEHGPMYRDLLIYAGKMPRWLLRYNRRMLLLANPPGRLSQIMQTISRLFGNPGIRLASLARALAERCGVKMRPTF